MEQSSQKIIRHAKNVCYELQTGTASRGLFSVDAHKKLLTSYDLPNLHAQIIVIFFITQASHYALRRFKIPALSSEIIAGMILGPNLLGRTEVMTKILCDANGPKIIDILSRFGLTLFMFIIGVKMDVNMVFSTGNKAWAIGITSYIIPEVTNISLVQTLKRYFLPSVGWQWSLFVGTIHAFTPFPVIFQRLEELKIVNSELGRLGLCAALISDILNTSLFVFWRLLGSFVKNTADEAVKDSLIFVVLVIAIIFLLRPAMYWVVSQTPEGKPVENKYISTIFILVVACAFLSHRYNRTPVLGAYILGLATPSGPPLGSALVKRVETFAVGVLLPIIATTTVMRADFESMIFGTKSITAFTIILITGVFLSKFAVCLMIPLRCKIPFKDAITLALIMNCTGIIQMTSCAAPWIYESIPSEAFAMLNFLVFINATAFPLLIRSLYDPSRKYAGYQKRNIMDLKPNAELKIVAGIHKPDNIDTIIHLLDVCQPTKESPITAYAIHLVELVGQAAPIFISHQRQKLDSGNSYSMEMILAFDQYAKNNKDAVSVNNFTAVSSPEYMQEDVCDVALDNLASLIVLPFHRKWSREGLLESESNVMRNLNCNVLARAPCSVSILVDNGHLGLMMPETSSGLLYNVGMVYIGGKDDREALSMARRMARGSTVKLTVVHLVDKDDASVVDWDRLLDNEVLKILKSDSSTNQNVEYKEELVEDGSQTSTLIRSMANQCNMMIVGRRYGISSAQTSGLNEWCEFPELGLIGDIVASPEFNKKSIVLIVQQQHTSKS